MLLTSSTFGSNKLKWEKISKDYSCVPKPFGRKSPSDFIRENMIAEINSSIKEDIFFEYNNKLLP